MMMNMMMLPNRVCLLLVLLAVNSAAGAPQPKDAKSLISVFNIIKFSNDECVSDTSMTGTCFTSSECKEKGGTADGSCASGYGVCCLFSASECGLSTDENNTIWRNPTTLESTCRLQVCPSSSKISQLRLDFMAFSLDGPNLNAALPYPAMAADSAGGSIMTLSDGSSGWTTHTNTHGQCLDDSLTVESTGAAAPPVICGENAGQHMYVEMNGVDCILMTIRLANPLAQTWTINVAQIEAGDDSEAPIGCLQYFTTPTGTFSSFNFLNSVHLANQEYNICVRREAGMCDITYTASTFQVSAIDYPNNFGSVFGKCEDVDRFPTSLVDPQHNLQRGNDWVTILMGKEDTSSAISYDRFCGRVLHADATTDANAPITSSRYPFRVGVHFDGSEATGTFAELSLDTSAVGDADRGDVGFEISYVQNSC